VLYCLLVVAQVGYVHLIVFGFHQSIGPRKVDLLISHPARILLVSVFLAWRVWLGGAISWTLLVSWGVLEIAASVTWALSGSPFAIVPLPMSVACLVLLFMPAVLDRAAKRDRLNARAATRRRGYGQPSASPDPPLRELRLPG
jgi:hypothetical protein